MNFKKYHVSKNLFDKSTAVDGYGVDNNSGNLFRSAALSASDYINISGESYIRATYITSSVANQYGAFYDNNKTFISGYSGYSNAIAVPQNAVYTRITARTEYIDEFMLNSGSQPLPYEPYSSEVWHDIPHYIHNTSTDTITTPADIYANDTKATVGLKGNMSQSGTPTPDNPIQPQECGDFETDGAKAGQYKIPILNNSQTTNVYLGEVQTTRKIRKVVFDGTENGWILATLAGHSGFIIRVSNTSSEYPISPTDVICTHYRTAYGNENGVIYTLTDGRCIIIDDRFTTAADFKAYLAEQYAAGTPVTVWYVLAKPTTGIVNEPLRKIGTYADEVSGITIPTIAGANTISVGTTLQPSEVTVNYKGWHPVQSVHEAENGAWT